MNNNSILSEQNVSEWDRESHIHVTNLVKDTAKILFDHDITTVRIVDVGSNVGKFIELLAVEGFVIEDAILIEPVSQLLEYSKQKFPHFKFENRVVSDVSGPVCMVTPNNTTNLGISRIIPDTSHAAVDSFVEYHDAITLTDLLRSHYPAFNPNLIKIDAEDYDVMVLDGLFDFLDENRDMRPVIVFEVGSTISVDRIIARYATIGYREFCTAPANTSRDIFLLP